MRFLGLPLLLVIVGTLIYLAVRRSRSRTAAPYPSPGPGPSGPPAEVPRPTREVSGGLAVDLARWAAAGLLTEQQVEAILAHEQLLATASAPVPAPSARRRIPGAAEALGYLGGLLAIIGLVLLMTRYWPDMALPGRLAISGSAAVALFAGGAFVHEQAHPALGRLRGFMWLMSSAATGLFGGVLAAEWFHDGAKQVVLFSAGAVAAHDVLLWWRRERPLQQMSFLAGSTVFIGALVALVAEQGPIGLTVWAVGAVLVALGLQRRTPLPLLTETLGAVAVIVGAIITPVGWQAFGLVFAVVSASALLLLAAVPGLAAERRDQLLLAILGGVALLEAVPSALGYFARDAGVVTGLATWVVGAALIYVGGRHLIRLPLVALALGGAVVLGGAALTAVQWRDVGPVFGIITAIGLIALGMLPDRVLLSVWGSVGLLVNVPWTILRFFPGEGRAPLLILVSGGLIVGSALLLARMGDRFRKMGGPHHGAPPSTLTGGV